MTDPAIKAERIREHMQNEFQPNYSANDANRTMQALEYQAYHLGEISRALTNINLTLNRIAGRMPS